MQVISSPNLTQHHRSACACRGMFVQALALAGECSCKRLRLQGDVRASACACRGMFVQAQALAGECSCKRLRLQGVGLITPSTLIFQGDRSRGDPGGREPSWEIIYIYIYIRSFKRPLFKRPLNRNSLTPRPEQHRPL